MKPRKISAVYFSGTGTTEMVVCEIGQVLSEKLGAPLETVSFTLPKARNEMLRFGVDDLVVLGVPTYAGRVPNVLLPYIKEKIIGNGAMIIPVVLYGNRHFDDSLIELKMVAEENHFVSVAAGAFVGEHSFSVVLGGGRPDAKDLEEIRNFARRVADKVQTMEYVPDCGIEVEGCNPVRPYYTPRDRHGASINILKVKPLTDLAKCTRCLWCVENCPMGSICEEDPGKIQGICIKCNRCVKGCKQQAKFFDDAGYLYHKSELEEQYSERSANHIFY